MDLDAHRGEHRLFLTFAASRRDGDLARQDLLLEGSGDGFAERDLRRGDLFGDGTGNFDGAPVPPAEVAAVRERFGVEPGAFTALLVGKDGTVKHRSDEPVGLEELYALVDAMPMRRREMRERGEA
ncbi:DUF4174 domain-containing protein [Rubrobacter marinus]|uniref:DUF4174 domain-containing protein n=1 Tax=Rubrobacter marinus TaxID=2653852 RepID=UPI00140CCE77|nr:DUF4174 domain-containing protein [Rubrobacter marinus]